MSGDENLSYLATAVLNAAQDAAELIAEADGGDGTRRSYLLGMAAYNLREFELALAQFSASYNDKASAETAARIALCNWRLGKLPEAENWILNAIGADADGCVDTRVNRTKETFMSILATIQMSRGKIEDAAQSASKVLEKDSADVSALSIVGRSHMLRGEPEKAEEYLQKSLEILKNKGEDPISKLRSQEIEGYRGIAHDLKTASLFSKPYLSPAVLSSQRQV